MIKDSGERTQFDTGAVRDMHTGKGRMDLLPWEPLAEVGEIKIPLEVEPSDLPPILANVSFTITMDCPRWLRRKLAWWIFKARLKDLIHRIFHF